MSCANNPAIKCPECGRVQRVGSLEIYDLAKPDRGQYLTICGTGMTVYGTRRQRLADMKRYGDDSGGCGAYLSYDIAVHIVVFNVTARDD